MQPGCECGLFASENCLGYLDKPVKNVQNNYSGLACGHIMCNNCWTEWLVNKIGSNEVLPLRCVLCMVPTSQQAAAKAIVPGCAIPSSFVDRHVPAESFKRYQYLVGKAYVESNPCIKWCSFPDCGY